jgi:deoxyadenosine/deoxycytidine kinase
MKHKYIAIEGNIGAGKTTLCNMLAKEWNCSKILEQFTDNPFLPHFYSQPERYGFPVELFFMTERHKQLQEFFAKPNLFKTCTVADYFFVKTLLFAQHTLQDEEYRLFQRLYNILTASFPQPDLIVYLHRSVPDLQRNIRHRGRDYEQNIADEYLHTVQTSYLNYLKALTDVPVLLLYVDGVRFWEDETAYQKIVDCISESYSPRVYHLNLF